MEGPRIRHIAINVREREYYKKERYRGESGTTYLSDGFVRLSFRFNFFTPLILIILVLRSFGTVFGQDLPKVTIAHSSRSIEAINFFVAEQHGYFKAEGLDVRIVQIRANVAIAAALAGDVDVLGSITSTISAIQKGAPIKVLAITLNRPLFFLVTRPDLKSIADFSGKMQELTFWAIKTLRSPRMITERERRRVTQASIELPADALIVTC